MAPLQSVGHEQGYTFVPYTIPYTGHGAVMAVKLNSTFDSYSSASSAVAGNKPTVGQGTSSLPPLAGQAGGAVLRVDSSMDVGSMGQQSHSMFAGSADATLTLSPPVIANSEQPTLPPYIRRHDSPIPEHMNRYRDGHGKFCRVPQYQPGLILYRQQHGSVAVDHDAETEIPEAHELDDEFTLTDTNGVMTWTRRSVSCIPMFNYAPKCADPSMMQRLSDLHSSGEVNNVVLSAVLCQVAAARQVDADAYLPSSLACVTATPPSVPPNTPSSPATPARCGSGQHMEDDDGGMATPTPARVNQQSQGYTSGEVKYNHDDSEDLMTESEFSNLDSPATWHKLSASSFSANEPNDFFVTSGYTTPLTEPALLMSNVGRDKGTCTAGRSDNFRLVGDSKCSNTDGDDTCDGGKHFHETVDGKNHYDYRDQEDWEMV